ncbi:MAG: DNA repair protein RecO [Puniceicoccales bacterium]|jgi:recombinational DNA repair protein (RecF pathway)|nr:DNA repair protein RecO [Puniceicoccales bacterium]
MDAVETSGIVISVQNDEQSKKILSVDIFTIDYGIMRWFIKSPFDHSRDYMFEDVEVIGNKITETAGKVHKMTVLSNNSQAMKQNRNYQRAEVFVKILRKVTFDGVPLENLFMVTKQTIKNFVSNFNADMVLLKALYLLCREEGYAVDSIWMYSLSHRDRTLAKSIITSKFDANIDDGASHLIDSLQTWILSL